jgi:hypothetical protein
MPEMIRDGRTGWLADQASSDHLAQTLRRALATPPDEMAEMGRQASDEIEQICSPRLVLEKQLEFRSRTAQRPATRSLSLPVPQTRSEKISSIPEVLLERSGWPFHDPANHLKSRTPQQGVNLIDVFNLARENPGFFFDKAVWAVMQVRKKLQVQGK